MSLRRDAIASAAAQCPQNAGLAFERYLRERDNENRQVKEHLDRLNVRPPPAYRSAYLRWRELIDALPGARLGEATLASPLAIGLGAQSPIEVGIRLHHTYGVPLIPGSTVKGFLRAQARAQQVEAEAMEVLFGTPPEVTPLRDGCFAFFDAWLVPVDRPVLKRDVITVHHPKYYAERGGRPGHDVWPTDFDDPNPVPFLTVRPGAKFLFALQGPEGGENWLDYLEELLTKGLAEVGIGAKTNAGYGRFEQPKARPKRVVWENCTLVQAKRDDPVTITGGPTDLRVAKADWADYPKQHPITDEQRTRLRAGELVAAVTVEEQEGRFRFVGIAGFAAPPRAPLSPEVLETLHWLSEDLRGESEYRTRTAPLTGWDDAWVEVEDGLVTLSQAGEAALKAGG